LETPGDMKVSRLDKATLTGSSTLRDGVSHHLSGLAWRIPLDHPTTALEKQFSAHDACHVLFGCGTDPVGEAMVSTWAILGTTMTLRRKLTYFEYPSVRAELRNLGVSGILRAWWLSVPFVIRVAISAVRMRRLWDFDDFERHLDRTIEEIRYEYGIKIVPRDGPGGQRS
jgi:hypothetical protein